MLGCLIRASLRFSAVVLLAATAWPQSIISTVVGTEWIFPGDRKPALSAPLGGVTAVAVDRDGNVVFADPANHMVMRVNSSDGTITVLAGNGLPTFSGDGGPATSAALSSPSGVAIDTLGNIYISDLNNYRVRKVSPDGIITTFAGNGIPGFSGDGGPANRAQLNFPLGITTDGANNVYFVDRIYPNNQPSARIRRITPDGTITTVAGNGQAGFSGDGGPATNARLSDVEGLAVDADGNLYMGDFSNNRVRKVSPQGTITTFAGNGLEGYSGDGGPATSARLLTPGGVAVDGSGNVFIADTSNLVIRRVTNGVITTVAGNHSPGLNGDGGNALGANLRNPFGLAVDPAGIVYIADRDNSRVRKLIVGATLTTIAGNGGFQAYNDGISALNGFLNQPTGLGLDASGNIYIADALNNRIRKVTKDGRIFTIAGNGAREFSGDNGQAIRAGLATPSAVVVDRSGNVFVSDTDNHCIRRISPDGIISQYAGKCTQPGNGSTGLNSPYGLVLDNSGNLFAADYGNQRVVRIASNGALTAIAGNGNQGSTGDGGSATQASLNLPLGLGRDSAGNLYIGELGGRRIRVVNSLGNISTFASAGVGSPGGLFVDSTNNVYFTDISTDQVKRAAPNGVVSVVAGNGKKGFTGDGGMATQAALRFPFGVIVDGSGNVLFADVDNNRIRMIQAIPPSFDVNPSTLSYTAKSKGSTSEGLTMSLSPSVVGMQYEMRTNADWLSIDSLSGAMPATIQVKADPTNLAPGKYTGMITVGSPGANPQTRTVQVSVEVGQDDPPKLSPDAKSLTFSLVKDGPNLQRQFGVTNGGGGTLSFELSSATDRGGSWLTVAADTTTATPKQPSKVTVTADPAGLDAGTYSGSLTIKPEGLDSVKLPVTMTIAEVRPKIVLSQTGVKFVGVSQGGAPLPQTLAVLNTGTGTLSYSVELTTLSGGPDWLHVSADAGSVEPDATDGPGLAITAIPGGLDPGEYYGQIRVSDPNAVNSPQILPVVLTVQAEGTNPGPEVGPTGLVFTGLIGNSPGSQTVQVANLTANAITYTSTSRTDDGLNWLVVAPKNGSITPNEYGRILVQPNFTELGAGPRRGTVTLRFSDGSVRTIDVLGVISDGTGTLAAEAAPGKDGERLAPGSCNGQILPQFVTPEAEFKAVQEKPVSLAVKVYDGCGTPILSATGTTTVVSFSNGDPNVGMNHIGNGDWRQAWVPRALTSRVDMTVTVISTSGSYKIGQARRAGSILQSTNSAPIVERGVKDAATLLTTDRVAPGGLVTVIGKGLVDGERRFDGIPADGLPLSVDGTEVRLQDRPLPILFASDGQINAQIPYGIDVNSPQQIVVRRNDTLSQPEVLSVASAEPGILTRDASGAGPGFIFKVGTDGSLTPVDAGSPAMAGDRISIFCAGLGKVTPDVPAGVQPPSSPRARVTNPVSVTIGGVGADVVEATLRPDADLPGRYEVIVIMPRGVTPGDAAPVVLGVANQVSQTNPPVTMAVR